MSDLENFKNIEIDVTKIKWIKDALMRLLSSWYNSREDGGVFISNELFIEIPVKQIRIYRSKWWLVFSVIITESKFKDKFLSLSWTWYSSNWTWFNYNFVFDNSIDYVIQKINGLLTFLSNNWVKLSFKDLVSSFHSDNTESSEVWNSVNDIFGLPDIFGKMINSELNWAWHLMINSNEIWDIPELILNPDDWEEIDKIMFILSNYDDYKQKWWKIPKWYLVHWNPWIWKTLLFKTLALKFKDRITFYKLNKEDYETMFKWEAEKRLAKLLWYIKWKAEIDWKHAIIIMDEFEWIGGDIKTRSIYDVEPLNVFKRFLDGMSPNSEVTVLCSTNREIHELDPSLIRPWRIDKQIKISLPNLESRIRIIQNRLAKTKLIRLDQREIEMFAMIMNLKTWADIEKVFSDFIDDFFYKNRNNTNRDFVGNFWDLVKVLLKWKPDFEVNRIKEIISWYKSNGQSIQDNKVVQLRW